MSGAAELEAFSQDIIATVARQRLLELFADTPPAALHHVPERHGVGVVVLPTTALSDEQLTQLLRFRLAQYLAVEDMVSQASLRNIYRAGWDHEPRSSVAPGDLHSLAGDLATGEILAYAAIEAPPVAPPGTTLHSHERPLFPVEKMHGWGVFNRLPILPDLPIAKIREIGRLMKNQQRHGLDELVIRATVEVQLAVLRTLAGPLRWQVEAIVGDLEEAVAKRNLDYLHIPSVVIPSTLPHVAEEDIMFPEFTGHARHPFAFLCSDMLTALPRLDVIEQALAMPGKQGVQALLALKRDVHPAASSLMPPEGLPALTAFEVPQRTISVAERGQLLHFGEHLRAMDVFQELSPAEAATLGTFLERFEVRAGELIVRQGETGDDLFVIETGDAVVHVRRRTGETLEVARLGPGEYFGEIALVTGMLRTADVVALTPMTLLRLSADAYKRFLAQLTTIEQNLAQTAARRAHDTLSKIAPPDT